MTIFDGVEKAAEKQAALASQVAQLQHKPQIGAVLFTEDAGSRLYTRLKKEAAEQLGISYHVHEFSVTTPPEEVVQQIANWNSDASITGIIIQKPTRSVWQSVVGEGSGTEYLQWWTTLVSSIDEHKDVDGLHPSTLAAIADGTWREKGRVLPATCQAVIDILWHYCELDMDKKPENLNMDSPLQCLKDNKIIILGKSDLLGKPLYYYLHNLNLNVEMIGSKELEERVAAGTALRDADVIISATGRANLITGEMVKDGVAVIDVGEPKGDVEFSSVADHAGFITPVPGGVGPMTVVCLMANGVRLIHGK